MENLYKFDKESLLYVRSNKVLKYRVLCSVLVCFTLLLSSFSAQKIIKEKELTEKIKHKEQIIDKIKEPLRKEYYLKDLLSAIGYNFPQKTKKQIETFTNKHKNKIEKAKIPMTLVVWIAFKESTFNVEAKNKKKGSTACGLFGFIDSTWIEMCKLKGVSTQGRFDEHKQVDILITYLNYQYNKHGSWYKVMRAYGGNKLHYPVTFLLK